MDIKRTTKLRWVAPMAIVATAAAGSLVAANPASADPNLEPRTAEQLISDVAASNVDAFSGTFSQTANLGLPDLGSLTGGDEGSDNGLGIQQFLSGTTTARVWQSGDSSRLSLPDGVNETSVYSNGDTGWIWSSKELTATKFDASAHEGKAGKKDKPESNMTPAEAAKRILAETEKDSTVTTTRGGTVAGRSAYELVVTPKQTASLVERIEIAIDGETKMPIQVEVFADGVREPAAEMGFSYITFDTPDASVFDFTPPPGAKVEQAEGHDKADKDKAGEAEKQDKADSDKVKTVGEGWATVQVAEVGKDMTGTEDPQAQQVLNTLPKVSGDWGSGRLFEGPLFSAVLTDDGRVAMGAVAPELLYSALR